MRSRRLTLTVVTLAALATGGLCQAGSGSVADQLASGLENMFQDTQSAQTASTAVGYASTAGELSTVWQIGSDVNSSFSQATSASNNPNSQAGEEQANQAFDNFVHQALPNDVASLIVPGGSATIQKAENIANDVESAANSVEDSASAVANRVSSYLSGSSDYGLEPGSSDAQAAQQAVDASGQSLNADASDISSYDSSQGTDQSDSSSGEQSASTVESAGAQSEGVSNAGAGSAGTVESAGTSSEPASSDATYPSDSGASTGSSAAMEESAASAPSQSSSSGSSNDLLEELQEGGIDTSSSGGNDSSTITSSDLAGIGGSGSSGSGSSNINVQQLQASIARWDRRESAKAQAEKDAEEQAQQQEEASATTQSASPQQSYAGQAPAYSSGMATYSSNSTSSGGDCNSVIIASQQRWCNIPSGGSICASSRALAACYEHGAEDGANVCPASLISTLQQEAAQAEQTANSVCVNGAAPAWQNPGFSSGYQLTPPPGYHPTPNQHPIAHAIGLGLGNWLINKYLKKH